MILWALPRDEYAFSCWNVALELDLFIWSFIEIAPWEMALFYTVIGLANLGIEELLFLLSNGLVLSLAKLSFAVPKADLLLKLF